MLYSTKRYKFLLYTKKYLCIIINFFGIGNLAELLFFRKIAAVTLINMHILYNNFKKLCIFYIASYIIE